jgi:hypothetical protein
MARIAFSFSNSMGSVPWGSDPGISEKHRVVGNLASFAIAHRVVGNSLLRVALPWEPRNPVGFDVSWV